MMQSKDGVLFIGAFRSRLRGIPKMGQTLGIMTSFKVIEKGLLDFLARYLAILSRLSSGFLSLFSMEIIERQFLQYLSLRLLRSGILVLHLLQSLCGFLHPQ